MSKHQLRKEKDCLNCGSLVEERFCSHCGQENIPVRQSVGSLISHFIADIFHFDGNFFLTLRQLFTRPGLVPREYVRGRRKRYLDPIRMYLFTSAIFFLIFFSIAGPSDNLVNWDDDYVSTDERLELAGIWDKAIDSGRTELVPVFNYLLDTSYSIRLQNSKPIYTTNYFLVNIKGKERYLMPEKYTRSNRNRMFENWLSKPFEKFEKERRRNQKEADSRLLSRALHQFPYLLFLSLPFFALILKLLYSRHKELYYSDHAVFTLYQYILTFFLMLLFFGFAALDDLPGLGFLEFFTVVIFLSGGIYLFIAMRRFYQQGFWKTLFKFLSLNILATLVMVLLLIVLTLLAFVQY